MQYPKLKIVIAGDFFAKIYEEIFAVRLKELGHTVIRFKWGEYFKFLHHTKKDLLNISEVILLFQNKFKFGPVIRKINRDLISLCKNESPDLVIIYRATHVYASTIKELKAMGITVFSYNNDDPFSKSYPRYFWRHYIKAMHFYDFIFSYRSKNLIEYKEYGVENVTLLKA